MIIEISIAVIALAFLFLIIYLILLIQTLRITLKETNTTLIEARKKLLVIAEKVDYLNPLLQSLENVGKIIENKTSSFRSESTAKKVEVEKETHDTVDDIVKLTSLGLGLWQKFKKKRR